MGKKHLPVLAEHSIGTLATARIDISHRHERKVIADVAARKGAITCHEGCANCCYHPVSISVLEGILLYRHLDRTGKLTPALRQKLRDSADRQMGTTYEVWLLSLTPCPLLDDKKRCTVYEQRPLICRTYLASSDPHYCHPHRLGADTKIADRTEPTTEYHLIEAKLLKGLKLQHHLVPIGLAILLAERICKGEVELSAADKELIAEFVGKA